MPFRHIVLPLPVAAGRFQVARPLTPEEDAIGDGDDDDGDDLDPLLPGDLWFVHRPVVRSHPATSPLSTAPTIP